MILNRVAKALKSQDWTTVSIEFLLVVLGVLVALEVDRYNESQKERALEVDYLISLQRDIEKDIEDLTLLTENFATVENFGESALETLSSETCAERECWQGLVSVFHASQWLDVSLNTSTFEEMKRLGLPSNAALKNELEEYYVLGELRKTLTKELPEYRRLVRSIIPHKVQQHIWSKCYSINGRFETYLPDCDPPISSAEAKQVIDNLRQTPAVLQALTFWLSNLSLTTLTLPKQITSAQQILDPLKANIHP